MSFFEFRVFFWFLFTDCSCLCLAKYVRGMYAVRVKGRVPDDVEQELHDRGIRYRPRDQTDQD